MILNKQDKPLGNIYYISIPAEFSNSIGDFKIDQSKKLPVETDGIENWNPETLTWEMIISAMLKIMAYDLDHKDIEYYRDFVKAVRPNIINELTDSGIIKSKDKKYILAEEIFLAIYGLEPQNIRNQLNLAVLYEEKADCFKINGENEKYNDLISDVKTTYLTLIDHDSVLTDVYFNAGYFFIKIREFGKAEECFKSFIEFSDDEDKIEKAKKALSDYKSISGNEDLFNSAYNAILAEDEYKCIEMMSTYLEKNPEVWNGWFLLGWAYRRISNFTEARSSLEKALELNKKDADINNELAICFMELGDYDNSQKYLEKALIINPEDVKIISNMGIIQLKQGNREKAKNFFETVLVLDPEDLIAKQYLDNI